MKKSGPVSSPIVGYGTFCGSDPLKPSKHKEDAGSSGGFATGCPHTGGATGTGKGTDFSPSWPIEDLDEPEIVPEDPKDPTCDEGYTYNKKTKLCDKDKSPEVKCP